MTPRRSLSLAAKLPLAIALLLSVTLFAMAVLGYLEVREGAVIRVATQLEYAARQIVSLLQINPKPRMAALDALAREPEVGTVVVAPDPRLLASVGARLAAIKAAAPNPNAASIEIWDAAGRRVSTAGPRQPLPDPTPGEVAKVAAAAADGPGVTPFAINGERIVFSIVAPIRQDRVATGYVVERRVLQTAGQGVSLVTRLIGADARLLIGNSAGDVWTDFNRQTDGPPPPQGAMPQFVQYRRADGTQVFARPLEVPDTPFAVATEFPQAGVMAPVHRYVRRAWIIAITVALIGAAIGWTLSRRVTRPLARLTRAAERIAAGEHAERVNLKRGDELGRLAWAFDTMAEQVERGRQELEHRVDARTAELHAANKELEAFSYSVSHDLRAPLRAINGFSRILLEDHATSLSEEGQHYLQRVSKNATAMGELIDDLLAFSRLSRQPLTTTRIDMGAMFESVIEECQRAEPDRAVKFVVGPLPPAAGDSSLVKQIAVNLVSNAVKFTRKSANATVEIGATTENGVATYFVRDNGVGFDPRYADKLFGVFQRLHRADDFEGTGVGLAIVQRIAVRHGGRAWAESEVGSGATFYFTLPEDRTA